MKFDNPHISFPFRLRPDGQAAVYVEQDDPDEVLDCVQVLLLTPLGSRDEVPDYGVGDPAFRERGADLNAIIGAVERWEPRAAAEAEQLIDQLSGTVQINVSPRSLSDA